MKMVVEWEGGGWETDDLLKPLGEAELEKELVELVAALTDAGDAAETAKVRFSGGRRCTREVLEAMQEQYAEHWRPASQLRFLNSLLEDNDGFQKHLYSLYLLEHHRGDFKKGAKAFIQGYRKDFNLVCAADSDKELALHELYKGVTTYIDDLGRRGADNTDQVLILWWHLDFEKIIAANTPKVYREWEGNHCYCDRVITLKDMGVQEL